MLCRIQNFSRASWKTFLESTPTMRPYATPWAHLVPRLALSLMIRRMRRKRNEDRERGTLYVINKKNLRTASHELFTVSLLALSIQKHSCSSLCLCNHKLNLCSFFIIRLKTYRYSDLILCVRQIYFRFFL